MNDSTKCLSCQAQQKMNEGRGAELTDSERNHWMLWGCTCAADVQAEALDYMDRVTR